MVLISLYRNNERSSREGNNHETHVAMANSRPGCQLKNYKCCNSRLEKLLNLPTRLMQKHDRSHGGPELMHAIESHAVSFVELLV